MRDLPLGVNWQYVGYVDRHGNQAIVVAARVKGWRSVQTIEYVEFCTDFESGESVSTINTLDAMGFRADADATVTQAPTIRDADELHRLHRFILDRSVLKRGGPPSRVLAPPAGGGVDDLLDRVWFQTFEREVALGWMRCDDQGDHYCFTVIGAYLFTWRNTEPVKTLLRWYYGRRLRRALQEFRRASPKPGQEVPPGVAGRASDAGS